MAIFLRDWGDKAYMGDQRREGMRREVQPIIDKYPAEKRHILPIMQDVQKKFNYLPKEALEMIAAYVGTPVSRVYSMATFYKAFSLVPRGRVHFRMCDGTACHIRGSQVVLDEIHKSIGISPGETTPDGQFSLETVNCLGACALAPVLVANQKVHPKVTPAAMREIIKQYGGLGDEPTTEA